MQDPLPITPLKHPVTATVSIPGSKSITNRALILANLVGLGNRRKATENTVLTGALRSEDTEVMINCLRRLGCHVDSGHSDSTKLVIGASPIHYSRTTDELNKRVDLFVGNSGTTMRFLMAALTTTNGYFRLDGSTRMRQRPIGDLVAALNQLGASVACENQEGFPPVIVRAGGLRGGHACIKGEISSQFLSGLLMAAPLAHLDVVVEVAGPLVSRPYVSMTVAMMRQFGLRIETEIDLFRVPGRQTNNVVHFDIEPDATAASYFFAAAAITGSHIRVPGLTMKSLQGDMAFVQILEEMGCRVTHDDTGVAVEGNLLHGVDVDMNGLSDCVMTLAAVACFAGGPTRIRGIGHIRLKESDRIAALATELRRVGAAAEEYPDGLMIQPRPLRKAVIETYNDHRMAMSMALIGLRASGIQIRDPGCVAKTYPRFFDDLQTLYDRDA